MGSDTEDHRERAEGHGGNVSELIITLNGRRALAASQEAVWLLVRRPERWSRWVRRLDEAHYRVTFEVAVGPLRGSYGGFLTMKPLAEGEALDWQLKAQNPRGEIWASGTVEFEAAEGETLVAYAGKLALDGELATHGDRLAASNARAGIRHLFEALEATLRGEAPAVETEYQPPTTEDWLSAPLKWAAFVIGFLLLYRALRRQG